MAATLVVIEYDDPFKAEEMRLKLRKMQKEYLLDLEDAVVAVKDEKGKIKLHQMINLAGLGAVSGGFWGALIGLIFLNPLLGMAMGAAAGAVSGALRDVGIDDNFMKELATGAARRRLRAVRAGAERHAGSGAGRGQGDGRQDPEDVAHSRERGQAPGGAQRSEEVAVAPADQARLRRHRGDVAGRAGRAVAAGADRGGARVGARPGQAHARTGQLRRQPVQGDRLDSLANRFIGLANIGVDKLTAIYVSLGTTSPLSSAASIRPHSVRR